jgi:hypothetical protein
VVLGVGFLIGHIPVAGYRSNRVDTSRNSNRYFENEFRLEFEFEFEFEFEIEFEFAIEFEF